MKTKTTTTKPAPAPVETFDERVDAYIEDQRRAEGKLKAELARWAESVAHDPLHALSWADSVFRDAGLLRVLQSSLRLYDMWRADRSRAAALSCLQRDAIARALRGAGQGSRSTSVPSNLAADSETAAWAGLVAELDSMFDFAAVEVKS